MVKLIYCIFDMPSERIKEIYKTLHDYSIPHEVIQNPKNNSVYTIECQESKKTAKILKDLGFN